MIVEDYILDELGRQEASSSLEEENVDGAIDTPADTVAEQYQAEVDGVFYIASGNSLYMRSHADDKEPGKFISSLIVVVSDARDIASSSWGRVVRFEDCDGNTKQLYLKRSDIATCGSAVVKTLADEGLVISTSRGMVDALINYLNLAPALESDRAICSDRIGWHDQVYLLADNSVIGNGAGRFIYTGTLRNNAGSVKGFVDDWNKNVGTLCRGNSVLILVVSMSFASVLLTPLGIESGGVHLYGQSSTGKSTALYVAASVFGKPDSMMGSWKMTPNGVEARARRYNDSLMLLDELHQSNPKDAGDVAYLLMNGQGKQRANVLGDARDTASWRVNVLSSGETAYAAFVKEGGKNSRTGQEVRMLDVSSDMGLGYGVFETLHDAEGSNEFAELLKTGALKFYGSPIREFIEIVIGYWPDLPDRFKTIKDGFFESYVPADSSGQVKRVATKMALVAMAGEMASQAGITGWDIGEAVEAVGLCFVRWLENRGSTGQQEAEKAIDQASNFLLRHGMSRFIPIVAVIPSGFGLQSPDRPYPNAAGYRITKVDGSFEFLVFPDVYNSEICQGLNAKFVTETLVERGYLKLDSQEKPQIRYRLPGTGQSRVYHFNATIFSDGEEFDLPETELAENL